MGRQVISQAELNRIRTRGGKVVSNSSMPEPDEPSTVEDAAIQFRAPSPAPVVEPVAPAPSPAPVVEPAPIVEPAPVDNSRILLSRIVALKSAFASQLTDLRKKSDQIITALRADLKEARKVKVKPPVAWRHKIRRKGRRGLIDMILSWRPGEKVVAWRHKIFRTPQGLIDTIESTDGVVKLRHTVSRKNGVLDLISTTPYGGANK